MLKREKNRELEDESSDICKEDLFRNFFCCRYIVRIVVLSSKEVLLGVGKVIVAVVKFVIAARQ